MPNITLSFKKNMIERFRLERGQKLSIGRYKDNDVVIDNLGVSGRHASIDSIDNRFLLVDLQSKNGTFVNEKIVTAHPLRDKDRISIGKHTLVFNYDEEEKPDDEDAEKLEELLFIAYNEANGIGEQLGDMDRTMMLDTESYRNLLAKNAPKKTESVGVLSFLDSSGTEIQLTKSVTGIGRAGRSDVVVRGIFFKGTAATISKMPKGYYINNMGGFFKPKVNGVPIKESVLLNDLDTVKVGFTKMKFCLKS
jgi:pSer/pThr/pTyr-binding forkhead associated (FHA) protein